MIRAAEQSSLGAAGKAAGTRNKKPDAFTSGLSLSYIGEFDYATFVPHSSQNFAPGFSSFWQFEHFAAACEAPHSLQNFEPSGIAAPHLTHLLVAAGGAAPDSVTVAPLCFIAS